MSFEVVERMKLRTVLSELAISDYVAGDKVNLDGEVIVFPGESLEETFDELLVLAPEGKTTPTKGF